MNNSLNMKDTESEEVREIPKWTRRYVENKTMPMIIFLLVALGVIAAISIANYCFLQKRLLLGVIMTGASMLGWGCSFLVLRFCLTRCYAKEGLSRGKNQRQVDNFFYVTAIPLLIACAVLAAFDVIPVRLLQPITALFLCPLLIFWNLRWARGASFLGYLWASLYGAWAIALLFRLPLVTFPERSAGLEVVLAVVVTGLITGSAGHIYNRHALRKLKRLASLKQNDSTTASGTSK